MFRLKPQLLILVCCMVSGQALAGGSFTMFTMKMTNACIIQTGQNFMAPTLVSVGKYLATGVTCMGSVTNSANCAVRFSSYLRAIATGVLKGSDPFSQESVAEIGSDAFIVAFCEADHTLRLR